MVDQLIPDPALPSSEVQSEQGTEYDGWTSPVSTVEVQVWVKAPTGLPSSS